MRSNANGLRLNLTQSWRFDFCHSFHYGKYFSKLNRLSFIFAIFFRRAQERTNSGLIYNGVKSLYFPARHIHFKLYFYDGFIQEMLFNFRTARRKRRLRYKWVRGRKKWFARRRFFKISRSRRFFFIFFLGRYRDTLRFINIKRYKRRWRRKLKKNRFFNLFSNYGKKRWGTIYTILKRQAQRIFKGFFVSFSSGSAQHRGIRAPMVARYVVGSLVNRFDMVGTVYRLLRGMMTNWFTPGMKVNCSGRFNRRRRKTYKKFQTGKVGMYHFTHSVDYFLSFVRQKYGVCGIKVWLAHYINKSDKGYQMFTYKKKYYLYRHKKNIFYKYFKKKNAAVCWYNFKFTVVNPLTRRHNNSIGVVKNNFFNSFNIILKYFV